MTSPGQSIEILSIAVQDIVDRRDIYDCLARYCRGVNRFDREMILSAHHPDAIAPTRLIGVHYVSSPNGRKSTKI